MVLILEQLYSLFSAMHQTSVALQFVFVISLFICEAGTTFSTMSLCVFIFVKGRELLSLGWQGLLARANGVPVISSEWHSRISQTSFLPIEALP